MEITKDTELAIREAETLAGQYVLYEVTDNTSLSVADDDLTVIKKQLKKLEDERLVVKRKLMIGVDAVMALFAKPIDALTAARERINMAMSKYKREQEALRQEQERKLQDMARKEEDRKRKILEERAAKAAADGKTEKAAELLEKAADVYVPAPVVQSSVVETKNKPRLVWKYKVVDGSLIPREYMTPNDVMLGSVARATKGTLAIPGIEIYSEESKF